jgi:septation ring formation regulator EzrA
MPHNNMPPYLALKVCQKTKDASTELEKKFEDLQKLVKEFLKETDTGDDSDAEFALSEAKYQMEL